MQRRRWWRQLGEEVGTEGRSEAGAAREAAYGQMLPGVCVGGGASQPFATCVERGTREELSHRERKRVEAKMRRGPRAQ
ncbi:hypothetical protein NDU88_003782 [Pleurodeles waltl]|uniref:Uncharacterized protein n=1 Tax=Pleurodeles waltl TaxID=8319 RepID=A0AAV7RJJ5_PLEWA|nr:hypothetical protein NDU88_003782 [Pleurodeles waltl]